jgi:NAD(P)-dependent dehydrogenase (short-subunit alcohol dehydrogenase family)
MAGITASAALFSASDEAQFITGTEIVVDGGMTARCDQNAFILALENQ